MPSSSMGFVARLTTAIQRQKFWSGAGPPSVRAQSGHNSLCPYCADFSVTFDPIAPLKRDDLCRGLGRV